MIDGFNQEMLLQKRTKGWWPMYAKDENDELMLQGKVGTPYKFLMYTKDDLDKLL